MRRSFIYTVLLTVVFMPTVALAVDPTVPCGTIDVEKKVTDPTTGQITVTQVPDGIVDNPCKFTDIIKLGTNVITAWIFISAIIATIGFAYAGYLYITAMGSEEKIKHAHSIFYKTALGFAFMLSAWLIVKVFENAFLCDTKDKDCDTGTLGRSFLRNQ